MSIPTLPLMPSAAGGSGMSAHSTKYRYVFKFPGDCPSLALIPDCRVSDNNHSMLSIGK
jgi:hypothetical protein